MGSNLGMVGQTDHGTGGERMSAYPIETIVLLSPVKFTTITLEFSQ